jgi:hypothetical protein
MPPAVAIQRQRHAQRHPMPAFRQGTEAGDRAKAEVAKEEARKYIKHRFQ